MSQLQEAEFRVFAKAEESTADATRDLLSQIQAAGLRKERMSLFWLVGGTGLEPATSAV
jgi:hypothetical protein